MQSLLAEVKEIFVVTYVGAGVVVDSSLGHHGVAAILVSIYSDL